MCAKCSGQLPAAHGECLINTRYLRGGDLSTLTPQHAVSSDHPGSAWLSWPLFPALSPNVLLYPVSKCHCCFAYESFPSFAISPHAQHRVVEPTFLLRPLSLGLSCHRFPNVTLLWPHAIFGRSRMSVSLLLCSVNSNPSLKTQPT